MEAKLELLGVILSLNLDEMLDLKYNTRLIDIKSTYAMETAIVNAYRMTDR